ncbi:hypothetical protein ACT7DF_22345 [Bacillus cereus]
MQQWFYVRNDIQRSKQFIQTGTHKNVLVVGSDKLSKIVDRNDRNTAVLFGDGPVLS